MRLFTGIDLPDSVTERLDALISRLRAHAHIKWSPTYNLHVTTTFIGEFPAERLPELDAALKAVPVAPIQIDVRGLGWFPNAKSPRVFWAGIHASPSLAQLASATGDALGGLGIGAESRPFSPHLTLARIREPVPLQSLRAAIEKLEPVDFGAFTPSHFYLYRSERGHTGSIYTKLHAYPLPRS
jgi:2'-5' RNA ligase